MRAHKVPGRWASRQRHNPEEQRFAKAWASERVLPHLLGNGEDPRDPTEAEAECAATVIQWLGSPVGQAFLRDLGYERTA